jgi:chromosomal replication initiation ATPase DnaA
MHKEVANTSWVIGWDGESTYDERSILEERRRRQHIEDIAAVKRAAEWVPDKTETRTLYRRQMWRREAVNQSKALIRAVAFELGLTVDDITGKSRIMRNVEARAVVAKLLKERDVKRYSYPVIGRILGNRDHSTIINLLDKFDIYCRRNQDVWETYKKLGGRDAG